MTKIYVNGRFLTQRMTGVERYAYNICKAMAQLGQPFTIVCPKAPIQDCYDTSGLTIIHYGRGNSHIWEQGVLPFFFIGKRDSMLVSFTGLGSILVRRKIMTIHDLSFLENPSWFSRAYYWWYKIMTPLAARTSKHLITVSEFSKSEIQRFYPFLKKEKITVMYPATDKDHFHVINGLEPHEEPFALTVSSLDPRKNFSRLVEAFKGIEGCKLYIVGNANRVFGQQGSSGLESENVKVLGRVSDEELNRLYNQASCFIFPSIYEGFGIPPLEAMQCGCPVIVSDIPVVHEVCGDAAVYFNPFDVDDIRQTIKGFMADIATKRPSMVKKGFENTEKYSWVNSAKRLIELMK